VNVQIAQVHVGNVTVLSRCLDRVQTFLNWCFVYKTKRVYDGVKWNKIESTKKQLRNSVWLGIVICSVLIVLVI
jgi:hypothetical protein